jgi:hypothetical protein
MPNKICREPTAETDEKQRLPEAGNNYNNNIKTTTKNCGYLFHITTTLPQKRCKSLYQKHKEGKKERKKKLQKLYTRNTRKGSATRKQWQLNLDLQKHKRDVIKETLRAWSEEKKKKHSAAATTQENM